MKDKLPLLAVCAIVGGAVFAAVFRVTTAPDRIRMRLEVAKATCLESGGSWVGPGGQEICRPAGARD